VRIIQAASAALLAIVATAASAQWQSQSTYEAVVIDAPADKVWDIVKGWDGLHKWHPVFGDTRILAGGMGIGSIRELTIKDGPKFTEELLSFDNAGQSLQYKIIDSPLPVVDYLSTIRVLEISPTRSELAWMASWRRKARDNATAESDDKGVAKFLSGAYQAGLQSVKKMAEGR
jgi:hypothetical protein